MIVEYWECVSQLAEDAWEIQDDWVVALDLAVPTVATLSSDLSIGAGKSSSVIASIGSPNSSSDSVSSDKELLALDTLSVSLMTPSTPLIRVGAISGLSWLYKIPQSIFSG